MSNLNYGKVAYNTFNANLPEQLKLSTSWEDLHPNIRDAWLAVVRKILEQ
jgi:hypothetical protein